MNKNIFFVTLIFFISITLPSIAQIAVTPTNNATTLINNIAGPGLLISNPSINCSAGSAATFTGGASVNFPLNNGIVLSSGTASSFATGNSSVNTSGAANYPLLSQVSTLNGGSTNMFDLCVLEFDLIPSCDSLGIEFVFGSAEYPTYVCTQFNDVFGFFVTGPYITGVNLLDYNIATIPNTITPITVTTLSYCNNAGQPGPGSVYSTLPGGNPSVAYATNLYSALPVIPNQTYHFKLAIADAGDGALDSYVLLNFQGLFCTNLVTLSPPTQTICEGDSVLLIATGQAANGYTWSAPGYTNFISNDSVWVKPNVTSTYKASSIVFGTSVSDSTIINVIPRPQIAVTGIQDSICRGEVLNIQATGATQFNWNPPTWLSNSNTGNVTATPQNTITYMLQATNSLNNVQCVEFDTFQIKVKQLPEINIRQNNFSICYNDTSGIGFDMINADNYSVSPSSFSQLFQDSLRVFPNQTVYYKITASNYCADKVDSVRVRVIDPIDIQFDNPNPTVCDGFSTTITASGAQSFQWSPNVNLSNTLGNTVTANPTSTITYTVTGNNDFCTATKEVTVTIRPNPIIEFSNIDPSICYGNGIDLVVNNNDSIYWSPEIGLASQTGNSVFASPETTTVYQVEMFNIYGCKAVAEIELFVHPPINYQLLNEIQICKGDTTKEVIVWPTGGNSSAFVYNWLGNEGYVTKNDSVASFSPDSTSYFYLEVTDKCGTKAKLDSILITVLPLPELDFTYDQQACIGTAINFSNNSNAYAQWDFGDGNYSNVNTLNHFYQSPGFYNAHIKLVTPEGCLTESEKFVIEIIPSPNADFTFTPTNADLLNPTIYFYNNSSNDVVSWNWINDGNIIGQLPDISYTFSDTGFFQIQLAVSNKSGCVDTVVQTIKISDYYSYFIPNSFSPNGDGLNETFLPVGNSVNDGNFNFKVFNRNGEIIFESGSTSMPWNGKIFNTGAEAPMGVYVWKITFNETFGNQKEHFGTVNLLK